MVAEVPTETGAVVFVAEDERGVGVFEFGTTADPRLMALPRLKDAGTPLEQYMALANVGEALAPPELLADHRARRSEAPRGLALRTDGEVLHTAGRVAASATDGTLIEKDSYFANVATECSWELASFVAAFALLSTGAQGTIFDHCSQGSNSNHCEKAHDSWAVTGAIRNGYGRGLGICNVSGGTSIMQMTVRFKDLNGWHDSLFGWWEIPSGFWVAWTHIGNTWEASPEYYQVYQQANGVTASGAVYSAY